MKLADIARHLDATLVGDPAAEITGIAGIEEAGAGHLTFVANPKYAAMARTTRATAILVDPAFPEIETATLRLANPYLGFARAIELFYTPPAYAMGIHPTAVIAVTAKIGEGAHIGPYAVISDDVEIGPHATILAHAVVYPGVRAGAHLFLHAHAIVREHCHLGDGVIVQNGAVIGADGFGFARQQGPNPLPGGPWYKIVQSGPAVLEDNVEVQANACIDRASIGETRIQAGAKIDNLVQVGHGSTVGPNTLLCAQVGLAGSTTIGKNVILAGQVGVAGHLTVGDGVIATAQSGIPNDVAAGKKVSGYPAVDSMQWLRTTALINKLPGILRDLKKQS
ncbi:UDP-3-O-[3-hydroxymyristoyl] glucosamine N-acyltransferase [Granulicella pectinivorans]|uniref:UDP-3-O-acylglucosamine N-acyltransferase n=1 Tax=Granulicella pectinivorans TaxID=474950 RepID=A0A1I6MN01_9BACT|nr:UDP-3-O-(3-hydroxymyristoyl)glucosamine N-acyltransferase [Granulicella pectinivorans]SFS17096.1 UDP-3-O-[3-hydroxymyristoyl] glucosamine N-acyltransferase [Granulicella pectinivorans]